MTYRSSQIIKNALLFLLLLTVIGIVFLSCYSCSADTFSRVRAKFHRANTYYSEEKYDKAIAVYEEVLNSGFESGNLYYNLANSYFKEGNLGRAILNYEKAARLIPGDSDLKSNYEYAKSLIKRRGAEAKGQRHKSMLSKIFSLFTVDGLALFLAVLYTVILLFVLPAPYIPSIRKYRISALSILIAIFILVFAALFEKVSTIGREAIVIIQKADAKFEPFDSGTTYFTLFEGTKVFVISAKGSWYKIKRSDKKAGWVKAMDLEVF